MGRTVDYYFAPQSPWAYLGHQRLADIVQRTGATVRVMPIDLGGKVFPISGACLWANVRPSVWPIAWWSCSALAST